MPDLINLLPDSVANQIAAGEVVQRPASVVKELLENSLDAGARNIKLTIKESGKSLVQVSDDGCGMSETDARMSFERHATSKIKKAEDLFNILTMGFRGEALASIASVSSVEMKSRRQEDELGTRLVIEGGKLITHEPVACNTGTTIDVKNLFYNIPVRKNFLKSNPVEYRHVVEEFFHVGLAFPKIKLILSSENNEIYHLTPGNVRQRIVGIFGKRYDKFLVPVEEESPLVSIHGFIGKPDCAKKKRGEQYFFVNSRFIKNPYFNHAVVNAFDTLLSAETYPFYVLYLDIAVDKIDVNVHPTKTEVKFEDEKAIYSILKTSIQKALSQHHVVPSLDFEQEAFYKTMQNDDSNQEESKIKFDYGQPGSNTRNEGSQVPTVKASEKDWKELLNILKLEKEKPQAEQKPQEDLMNLEQDINVLDEEKKVLQVHRKYILSTLRSGIMIINQEFAHQRILFEEYLEKVKSQPMPSQKQMFPEVIELKESDFNTLKEILPELEKMGFDLELFGKRAFLINGLPAHLNINQPQKLLEEMIDEFQGNLGNPGFDTRSMLARTLAIKASIKKGTALNHEEMSLMIDKLFACKNPYFSPGGKPVFLKIDETELDKKFE